MMKKIVVGGLNGKMGSFLVEALKNEEDLKLVAGVSEVEDLTGDIPVYSDPQTIWRARSHCPKLFNWCHFN